MWSTDPWGPQEPLGSSRGQMYFHSNAKMAFASFTVLMAASMVRKQRGGAGYSCWCLGANRVGSTGLQSSILHPQEKVLNET